MHMEKRKKKTPTYPFFRMSAKLWGGGKSRGLRKKYFFNGFTSSVLVARTDVNNNLFQRGRVGRVLLHPVHRQGAEHGRRSAGPPPEGYQHQVQHRRHTSG